MARYYTVILTVNILFTVLVYLKVNSWGISFRGFLYISGISLFVSWVFSLLAGYFSLYLVLGVCSVAIGVGAYIIARSEFGPKKSGAFADPEADALWETEQVTAASEQVAHDLETAVADTEHEETLDHTVEMTNKEDSEEIAETEEIIETEEIVEIEKIVEIEEINVEVTVTEGLADIGGIILGIKPADEDVPVTVEPYLWGADVIPMTLSLELLATDVFEETATLEETDYLDYTLPVGDTSGAGNDLQGEDSMSVVENLRSEDNSDLRDSFVWRGFDAKAENRLDLAIKYFASAIELNPPPDLEVMLIFDICAMLKELGQYEKAQESLELWAKGKQDLPPLTARDTKTQLKYLEILRGILLKVNTPNMPFSMVPGLIKVTVEEKVNQWKNEAF